MLLHYLASTLAISLCISAWTIPAGTKEGTYSVEVVDGVEVHTQLEKKASIVEEPIALDPRGVSPNPLSKRDPFGWKSHCGCGYTLNPTECDRAVQALKDHIPVNGVRKIPGKLSWYSIRGPVVAFACNRVDWGVDMVQGLFTNVYWSLTERCGRYIAGTIVFDDTFYGIVNIGYMRWYPGQNFCANALGSPVSHC